jgi:hypothetical protein
VVFSFGMVKVVECLREGIKVSGSSSTGREARLEVRAEKKNVEV